MLLFALVALSNIQVALRVAREEKCFAEFVPTARCPLPNTSLVIRAILDECTGTTIILCSTTCPSAAREFYIILVRFCWFGYCKHVR